MNDAKNVVEALQGNLFMLSGNTLHYATNCLTVV